MINSDFMMKIWASSKINSRNDFDNDNIFRHLSLWRITSGEENRNWYSPSRISASSDESFPIFIAVNPFETSKSVCSFIIDNRED
jgi:hypothetical protein